jgi:hypothetical protein
VNVIDRILNGTGASRDKHDSEEWITKYFNWRVKGREYWNEICVYSMIILKWKFGKRIWFYT